MLIFFLSSLTITMSGFESGQQFFVDPITAQTFYWDPVNRVHSMDAPEAIWLLPFETWGTQCKNQFIYHSLYWLSAFVAGLDPHTWPSRVGLNWWFYHDPASTLDSASTLILWWLILYTSCSHPPEPYGGWKKLEAGLILNLITWSCFWSVSLCTISWIIFTLFSLFTDT